MGFIRYHDFGNIEKYKKIEEENNIERGKLEKCYFDSDDDFEKYIKYYKVKDLIQKAMHPPEGRLFMSGTMVKPE